MKKQNLPIYVTQPFMPPLEEFIKYLRQIWDSKWLTNNGPYHQQLEKDLAEFLGVPYMCLFANATLALITALQCLRITGEVITTPYSFVATTHSIWWNGIKPVFADVDPVFGNLDPNKVEAAITSKTSAILPVHVYGHPCKLEEFQRLADVYGLKLIYDAAHAFGVSINGKSVLNYGDLSILSFHATKVFNTFEGGAIICKDKKIKERIDYLKNFGFADELTVIGPGINAKMNEVQAVMGLLQLKHYMANYEQRKIIYIEYKNQLKGIQGIRYLEPNVNISYNYSYYPIFINEKEYGMSRDNLYKKLKDNNIFSRRYFYPLISNFPTYNGLESANKNSLSIANKLADQVICLPIYSKLGIDNLDKICKLIIKK
jgi:dTDP-4-amino-4,6-dideoxygalactose transaminase